MNHNQDCYKTKLCESFMRYGGCQYNNRCKFAHGYHELTSQTRQNSKLNEAVKKIQVINSVDSNIEVMLNDLNITQKSLSELQIDKDQNSLWLQRIYNILEQIKLKFGKIEDPLITQFYRSLQILLLEVDQSQDISTYTSCIICTLHILLDRLQIIKKSDQKDNSDKKETIQNQICESDDKEFESYLKEIYEQAGR